MRNHRCQANRRGRSRWVSRSVVLVGLAEVPVEEKVLPFGVADHPLSVPAELRIVRRQQQQTGQGPLPELLDHTPVAEVRVDPPVGRDRTEVDDPDVTTGRGVLLGGNRHSGQPTRRVRA